MKTCLSTLLTVIAISVTACATRLATQSPEDIDLSGTWQLNLALSQNVVLFPPRQGSKSNRGGRPDSGRGQGGRRNSSGATRPTSSNSPGISGPQILPFMTATEMTIEQGIDSMGVAYPNERYRDVDWGEKEIRGITTRAGWEQSRLHINSTSERLDVTEIYQLDASGKILTLMLEVEGRGGTREFVRVFDLVES